MTRSVRVALLEFSHVRNSDSIGGDRLVWAGLVWAGLVLKMKHSDSSFCCETSNYLNLLFKSDLTVLESSELS